MDKKSEEAAAPKGNTGKTDSLTITSDDATVSLTEAEMEKITGGTGSGTGKIYKSSAT